MRRILDILTLYAVALVADSVGRAVGTSVARRDAEPELDDKRKFEIGTEIAEQIWREQQLTSNRMTWNLTFQGFLFAAFSVVSVTSFTSVTSLVAIPGASRMFLQLVIALGGIAVGQATKHSIRASQLQRDYMKEIWRKLYNPPTLASYPRPFSVNLESDRGRHSATMIIRTILCMWTALATLAVFSNWELISTFIRRLGG
jgi:hypothetical protein